MNLRKTIDSIEFLDAFMYIALFRLALSLENCPAIGGTSSLLPLTPERNCRYGVSKGTADMLSPHHKISFFSTLLYSVYTELGILGLYFTYAALLFVGYKLLVKNRLII